MGSSGSGDHWLDNSNASADLLIVMGTKRRTQVELPGTTRFQGEHSYAHRQPFCGCCDGGCGYPAATTASADIVCRQERTENVCREVCVEVETQGRADASKDKSSEKKDVTSAVMKGVESRELNCEYRVFS
jgi:hypothetical protein